MLKYKLRPHHALCIHFFEGKGYSAEFIENMTSIIQSLTESSLIQLNTGEDIICTKCPNNENPYRCNEKVMRYDKTVLALCNLDNGQLIQWRDLKKAVFSQILQKDKLSDVCGDCQWKSICLEKLLTLH